MVFRLSLLGTKASSYRVHGSRRARSTRRLASSSPGQSLFNGKKAFFAASHFSDNSCCFRLRALIPPDGLLALQCVGADVASPTRPVFYQAVWLKQIATGILVRAVPIVTESAAPNGLSASSETPFGKT